VRVRAFEDVVVTPAPSVVRRRVVVDGEVLVVVEVAAVDALGADADTGWSGAFVFRTCVPANAVIPVSDARVIAVASPRSIALERTRGVVLGRSCIRTRTTRATRAWLRVA
jgi:hypothetical protein